MPADSSGARGASPSPQPSPQRGEGENTATSKNSQALRPRRSRVAGKRPDIRPLDLSMGMGMGMIRRSLGLAVKGTAQSAAADSLRRTPPACTPARPNIAGNSCAAGRYLRIAYVHPHTGRAWETSAGPPSSVTCKIHFPAHAPLSTPSEVAAGKVVPLASAMFRRTPVCHRLQSRAGASAGCSRRHS